MFGLDTIIYLVWLNVWNILQCFVILYFFQTVSAIVNETSYICVDKAQYFLCHKYVSYIVYGIEYFENILNNSGLIFDIFGKLV